MKPRLVMPNQNLRFVFLEFLLTCVLLSSCAQTSPSGPPPEQQVASINAAPPPPAPVTVQPPSMPSSAPGIQAGEFEQPPIVDINELLAPSMQSGPGFQVGQHVATNGAMGEYTLVATADVFHDDAGTYQVESLDLLKIRLSEVPAIAQLDNMSNTAVFAKALAASAARPVADAAQ